MLNFLLTMCFGSCIYKLGSQMVHSTLSYQWKLWKIPFLDNQFNQLPSLCALMGISQIFYVIIFSSWPSVRFFKTAFSHQLDLKPKFFSRHDGYITWIQGFNHISLFHGQASESLSQVCKHMSNKDKKLQYEIE